MNASLVVLLSNDPDTAPVVLEFPSDRFGPAMPLKVRIPIVTPDGRQQEVWRQEQCLHPLMATYRLERIEAGD